MAFQAVLLGSVCTVFQLAARPAATSKRIVEVWTKYLPAVPERMVRKSRPSSWLRSRAADPFQNHRSLRNFV